MAVEKASLLGPTAWQADELAQWLLRDENAVLVGSAEINLDAAQPTVLERMQFGVAEDLAVERFAPIENESIVAVLANPLDGDRLEQCAVWPAARE
ncbi:hypothetical protein [Mesorhizobium sp.]|uniref:hypothetical protein n=1 Tax=Mesorhizobium sp. TaxID=1871066 RepID=UPI00257A7DDB|nr:hypothetical protein [Mesorhizobium sp.]